MAEYAKVTRDGFLLRLKNHGPENLDFAWDSFEENVDLSGINFQEADLSGVRMVGANLRGADLQGVRFREYQADYDVVWSADLTNADLTDSNLVGASFNRAIVTGAKFHHVRLSGSEFSAAQDLGSTLLTVKIG